MKTTPTPETGTAAPLPVLNEVGVLRAVGQVIRTRILSGLFAALPIALTIFIVRYLYITTITLLTPVIEGVRWVLRRYEIGERFWVDYAAPAIAILVVLFSLYSLGLFVQTRWARAVDWAFLKVPGVNTIFKALTNVFQSLSKQIQGQHGFQRVVLVEFPHPGIKSLAFVTNTLRDAKTDRTILCVCVLTGVMPPAGFTLFVPEEDVIDVDWSTNQTIQAIVSGGITSPSAIHYFRGIHVPPTGPILDAEGHPIHTGAGDDANTAV